jgi:hypothetical protein
MCELINVSDISLASGNSASHSSVLEHFCTAKYTYSCTDRPLPCGKQICTGLLTVTINVGVHSTGMPPPIPHYIISHSRTPYLPTSLFLFIYISSFLEDYTLLDCNGVRLGINPTFQRNISPPSPQQGSRRQLSIDILLVACLPYSSALEMEAIYSSETSGLLLTTRLYNPGDRSPHSQTSNPSSIPCTRGTCYISLHVSPFAVKRRKLLPRKT